jgi:hypothetical protein
MLIIKWIYSLLKIIFVVDNISTNNYERFKYNQSKQLRIHN